MQINIQHFQLVLHVQAVLGVAPVSTECCWKWAYLGIQASLHKRQWYRQVVTWTWSTWRRCSRGATGGSRRAPPPPSRTLWPGPLLRRPRYLNYLILLHYITQLLQYVLVCIVDLLHLLTLDTRCDDVKMRVNLFRQLCHGGFHPLSWKHCHWPWSSDQNILLNSNHIQSVQKKEGWSSSPQNF